MTRNGWLARHSKSLLAWRRELEATAAWIRRNQGRKVAWKTPRERSLEIFGDEKTLVNFRHPQSVTAFPYVLRRIGVDYSTLGIATKGSRSIRGRKEGSFHHFIAGDLSGRRSVAIVLSENLDPWLAMRAMLQGAATMVFGTNVDGAAYCEGSGALARGVLDRFRDDLSSRYSFNGVVTLLWWGDLDRAGIQMLSRLRGTSTMPVVPFAAAYERMLLTANLDALPHDTSSQMLSDAEVYAFASELSDAAARILEKVLENGLRLPQEILEITTERTKTRVDGGRDAYSWRTTYIDRSSATAEDVEELILEEGVTWGPDNLDEENPDPYGDEFYEHLEDYL